MLTKNIEESEERFRGIIENALDIITLLDAEGTIIYNSPAFGRQLGYEPWEVLGQHLVDFVHADDRGYIKRELKKIIDGFGNINEALEFRFQHKDGTWRVFESVVSNLLNNQVVQAMVLNSRDVTGQKESEAELEKYRSHLEELVEQRTQELTAALEKEKAALEQQKTFISMVSHEFRTPLTIIDGNAQIIMKRGSTLDQDVLAKRSSTIRSAVDRLVRLIETILSVHTLESGNLTVTREPNDLIPIIRDVCMDILQVSPQHKIKIDVQKGLPKMMIDKKVVHQILANLISNAVKYTLKDPMIEVVARQDGDTVLISVSDNGVGIPENELPKMFTRYFRASTSGGIPGSGLGLSLVRQFVELHDGQIGIESHVGVGTTISMRLPINIKPKKEEEKNGKNITG